MQPSPGYITSKQYNPWLDDISMIVRAVFSVVSGLAVLSAFAFLAAYYLSSTDRSNVLPQQVNQMVADFPKSYPAAATFLNRLVGTNSALVQKQNQAVGAPVFFATLRSKLVTIAFGLVGVLVVGLVAAGLVYYFQIYSFGAPEEAVDCATLPVADGNSPHQHSEPSDIESIGDDNCAVESAKAKQEKIIDKLKTMVYAQQESDASNNDGLSIFGIVAGCIFGAVFIAAIMFVCRRYIFESDPSLILGPNPNHFRDTLIKQFKNTMSSNKVPGEGYRGIVEKLSDHHAYNVQLFNENNSASVLVLKPGTVLPEAFGSNPNYVNVENAYILVNLDSIPFVSRDMYDFLHKEIRSLKDALKRAISEYKADSPDPKPEDDDEEGFEELGKLMEVKNV